MDSFEVCSVLTIDDSACLLESGPYFLTLLFRYRSDLTILIMELLQLMESADDVLFFSELLSNLAEGCLHLKVLLEVVLTCLDIELEQVIELLCDELVVLPEVSSVFCRNSLYLLPFLLEVFDFLIGIVSLFRG